MIPADCVIYIYIISRAPSMKAIQWDVYIIDKLKCNSKFYSSNLEDQVNLRIDLKNQEKRQNKCSTRKEIQKQKSTKLETEKNNSEKSMKQKLDHGEKKIDKSLATITEKETKRVKPNHQ